ncbi:DNA internalization-related competence protein ComEC/Rec2 [Desulfosediminicola flagellatus]|uniref:DNA internalization-related competence protein ComEC/Rec2 n=1 Tax=Desulfosediminicola flagellatus TaxID=2569541 RepID=UPI00142EF633|nr:DNA internalization-related competence protein ComEC/Rec2 [Desulfosediminicola flagellatus]
MAATIGIFYVNYQKYSQTASVATLLLVFSTGIYVGTLSSQTPSAQNHIYTIIQESTDAVVVGKLQSMPSYNGTSCQAKIDAISIKTQTDTSFKSIQGILLLRLQGPWPKDYRPGDLLVIRAILNRPSTYKTPGTFDYPRWLARKNIWVTGYVRSPAQIHEIAIAHSLINSLKFFPENLRTRIGHYLDSTLSPELSSIYRALLLGDRSRIPDVIIEQFKGTGIMHILAISGVHVTILATLLFLSLYWLLRRSEWLMLHANVKKIAGILCIPLIIAYALLAGLNNPVIRASIISSVVILIFFSNRPKTVSSLIAIAALIILSYSPQAIFTASFQLSFAAFTSILVVIPLLKIHNEEHSSPPEHTISKWFKTSKKWIVACLMASTAAIVGTAPIMVHHFHRFPLLGPITNLIIEPIICLWALPLGLLSLPVMFIWPGLADVLLNIGGIGLHISLWVTKYLYLLPNSSIWSPSPGPTLLTVYYGSLFVLTSSWRKRRNLSYAFVPLFLLSLIIMLYRPLSTTEQQQTPIVHILDVGQGSSTVIQLDDGKTILIDGGGSSYSKPSVGERVIAPFLWSIGVTHLDTIIITHPDADHYNGIPFLIEQFSPQQIWTSTISDTEPDYQHMLTLALKENVTVHSAKAGDTITGNNSKILCLINTKNRGRMLSDRNAGLVIQLKTPTASYLFPGDIDTETETLLLENALQLKSTILLAAHHGSATSNSARFIERVDPRLIIASASITRNSNFPSQDLIKFCQENAISLKVTAQHGTLTFREANKQVVLYRQDLENENPLRRNREQSISAQIYGFEEPSD